MSPLKTLAAAAVCVMAVCTATLDAADQAEKSGAGTFVSFRNGELTLQGKSGLLVYQIGEGYQSFANNEDGPGSKLVESKMALSQLMPGTAVYVNVGALEISFGLDHRVIGTFVSYVDGKLQLVAAEASPGFVQRPSGDIALSIERGIPVLASIQGGAYQFAGPADEVLKTVKPGTLVTARSEFDPNVIEVIQLGQTQRKIERYVGQTRGTVRGTFMSIKDGILRMRGKGLNSLAANEYERVMNFRIADSVPIVESIDGGAYQPAGVAALTSLKEGTIVTVRKAEEVILEIQIGVAK
jgi:hypothetical protein